MSEKTEGNTLEDAVKGTDEPMGKKSPGSPAALVFLTFPIVLIVALVIVYLVVAYSK